MAAPSCLPSARRVAELCYERYRLQVDPHCNPELATDLEALAEQFVVTKTLETLFIDQLVPWEEFVKPPNAGHAAIADFLIIGAIYAGLSTNYDSLIERAAWDYGFDFQRALDGDEANSQSRKQAPLLKFHGCADRDQRATIWAPSQLEDGKLGARIAKSKTWMTANLREKDLLVVGFWSDWNYVNGVLGSALKDVSPATVTVVDPSDANDLQKKAPDLWRIANSPGVTFVHVQESGAQILDELRNIFSQNFMRQVFESGRAAVEEELGAAIDHQWSEPIEADSETLYAWRRDAEGVPSGRPAVLKSPLNAETVGAFHLLMRRAGAEPVGAAYMLNGRTVRVVNGSGKVLSQIRRKFTEVPALPNADVFVAAGAQDLGVPDDIMRSGKPGSIIRPAAAGDWLDFGTARQELQI